MPLYHHQVSTDNVSAIPTTFTSNTSILGYVCSASNTNNSYYPYKVWTQDYTTSEWCWWPGDVSLPQWVQIEVPEAFIPSGFMIANEVATPANLKAGIFQGSNNGSDWTDLYVISDWPNTAGYRHVMELSTNTAYKYYRLYATEGWSSGHGVSIQAMQIFRRAIETSGFDELGHPVQYDSAEDADCNISLIPKNGLIFYASLNGDTPDESETGQILLKTGTVTYSTFKGIPCAYFNGSSDLHMSSYSSEIPVGYNERTLSAWIYAQDYGWRWAIGYGNQGTSRRGDILGITSSYYPVYSQEPDVTDSSTNANGKWLHICGVVSNSTRKIYVNGVLKNSSSMTDGTVSNYGIYIGSSCGIEYWKGYLSSIRVYNRALTEDEIGFLANEFTPES